MPFWEVTLKDPLDTNKIICSGKVEADTEYGAKRAYFDSLYKKSPNLAQTPFSAVLPHMTTRKLETSKPKTSEFPPEHFFNQIREQHREIPIEEELENSSLLPNLILFVTKESLEIGRIPKECPICSNPKEELVIHLWNSNNIRQSSKNNYGPIIGGYYRRICEPCNSSLKGIFKDSFPLPWKLQLKKLFELFKESPQTYRNTKWEEGSWSLLSEEEWNRVKYIWDTTPRIMLLTYLSDPTKRKSLSKNKTK